MAPERVVKGSEGILIKVCRLLMIQERLSELLRLTSVLLLLGFGLVDLDQRTTNFDKHSLKQLLRKFGQI